MSERSPDAEALVRHADFLRSVARRLVTDDDRADDLVQDTYVAALESGGARRGGLGGWLAGIAKNLARMAARTDVRRRRREAAARPARAVPSPSETLSRLETEERLVRAVRSLPEPYRSTLVSRYLVGASAARIAEESGVPASTVRTRLSRALAMLRERLDDESDGDRRVWTLALLPLAFPPALAPIGAGSGIGTLVAKGATVMTAKKLVAAAVILVLVAAGVVTLGSGTPPSPPPAEPGEPAAPGDLPDPAAPAVGTVSATGPSLPAPVDLDAADRDLDLFGRVVDAKGNPIPGAELETLRWPWRRSSVLNSEGYEEAEPGPKTLSARDGTFLFRLRRGALVDLHVTHPDYGETTIGQCQAGERVRVVLHRGAEVEVVCTDEAGAPVADVELNLWRNASSSAPVYHRDGTTDDEGRSVFGNLTAGAALLRLEHPVLGSPNWQRIVIPETGRLPVEVTMPAGREIRGRVTDAETGSPIAGAAVGANWVVGRPVTTDAEGRYVFRGWTGEGVSSLHVLAEGYGREKATVPATGDVDFVLLPGDSALGRVVGADGAPVAGALVTALAYLESGDSELDTVSTTTAPDGRFRLTNLRRDIGPHTLVVQAAGHGKLLHDFEPHAPGAGEIDLGDLAMPAARAIEGRVLDTDGAPIPGVGVALRLLETHAIPEYYGGSEKRRTDDLGRFRFPDQGPGHYSIGVSQSGAPYLTKEVVLPADRDVLDIVIRRETGRSLTVRVLDPAGAPIAGAYVASQTAGAAANGQTDADGRVRFEGLPEREIQIYVFVPGENDYGPSPARKVSPADQEVEVRMTRAVLVRGVLLDPGGNPISRAVIRGSEPGAARDTVYAVTGDDGSFAAKFGGAGTVDLVFYGEMAQTAGSAGLPPTVPFKGEVKGISAPADGVVIRCSHVESGRALTVLVLGPDGDPVSGAKVFTNARNAFRSETTDAEGRARFSDLLALETTVVAHPPNASGFAANVVNPKARKVVPEGQQVEMRFRVGVVLTGLVRDPDGNPIEGATAIVTTEDGAAVSALSGPDGRFRIAGVPGAPHRISVSWADPEGNRYYTDRDGVRPEDGEVTLNLVKTR